MNNEEQRSGHDDLAGEAATFWESHYRQREQIWSGNPNPQLVSEAIGLTPGKALDVGCGEGADAHWLAERGWQVTAVDISTVAIQRGAARAAERGAAVAQRIEWLVADITHWTPAEARYDLVSAQYFQLPKAPREVIFRRLAAAVAPGGTLLTSAITRQTCRPSRARCRQNSSSTPPTWPLSSTRTNGRSLSRRPDHDPRLAPLAAPSHCTMPCCGRSDAPNPRLTPSRLPAERTNLWPLIPLALRPSSFFVTGPLRPLHPQRKR